LAASKHILQYGCWPSSLFAKSEMFLKIGGFARNFIGADIFCAASLTCLGNAFYSNEVGVTARVHKKSLTGRLGWTELYINMYECVNAIESELFIGNKDFTKILEGLITESKSKRRLLFNRKLLKQKIGTLLKGKVKDKSLVLYGVGDHTDSLFEWTSIDLAKIVGFADSNPALKGTIYRGLPVADPKEILQMINKSQADLVLISSCSFQDEIFDNLKNLGIDTDCIIKLY
jgi:hypothetical protein